MGKDCDNNKYAIIIDEGRMGIDRKVETLCNRSGKWRSARSGKRNE